MSQEERERRRSRKSSGKERAAGRQQRNKPIGDNGNKVRKEA